jgi:hypothetical protein
LKRKTTHPNEKIMFKKLITILPVIISSLVFTSISHAEHHGMKKDIVDVAAENGSFNTLVAAVKREDLLTH